MQKAIDFHKQDFTHRKKTRLVASFRVDFRAHDVAKMLTKCS